MTGKERMMAALTGKRSQLPVTPHWWGLYKFQYGGLLNGYEGEKEAWSLRGEPLAAYDRKFYEDFEPDMFHLTTGSSKNGILYETREYQEAKRKLRELNSDKDIDEFVALVGESREEVLSNGCLDHVKILSAEYGKDHFICLHEGNPVCRLLDEYLGFEEGLIAMLEEPERVGYLLYRLYDVLLLRMEAVKASGADAYAGSETYCTPDIISPDLYREIVFPAQKHFYEEVKKIGLIPITYFLGDVRPLLDDINKLGVAGLMVEESKKGFTLDAISLRRRLNPEIALFGNLDSVYTLEKGTVQEVKEETARELKAAKDGTFIMSNGCPLSFHTPPENIRAMIDTVREYNR